ncbi:hypothetical protein ACFL5V_13125, partial [Fibrobacterota bacterium]
GPAGEPVNICSGEGVTISTVLDLLIELSGLKVKVRRDSALQRPSDEPVLYGDNSKLKKLGWKPVFSMVQTLEAIYKDWLERV